MTINRTTIINEVEAPQENSFARRYAFLPSIDAIQDKSKEEMIDVIGVMIEVGDTQQFTSKDGKGMTKKVLRIADQSNRNIEITLWGEAATNFYGSVGSVLAIKNGRVNEFKGEKNISFVSSSVYEIDPANLSDELQTWYQQNGENVSITSLSLGGGSNSQSGSTNRNNKIETLASLNEQFNNGGGSDKKAIFVKVKGTLAYINHDDRAPLFYKSCTDNMKKVVENTIDPRNGKKWYCEGNQQYYDNYDCRYILNSVISDSTGSQFVTIFNKEGELVMGESAKNIENYRLNDQPKLSFVFDEALFKRYFFTIKAVEEMYQDELKLRCTVNSIEKIDYNQESRRLIEEIGNMI